MACNNRGVWNEAGGFLGFFRGPGVLPDQLVPFVVRGRVSGIALGALSTAD